MALSPLEKRLTMLLTNYWHEHRRASDTAEGIRDMWLADGACGSLAELRRALAWLDECRLIDRLRARDGRVRYRLRRGVTEASFARTLRRLAAETH